ncbi:hypothetical protein HYX70_02865 [Candidatus Saccharibacteria bacterium]|nr:hypothetical protein [Candidatus Saccharibacteria bacterium]
MNILVIALLVVMSIALIILITYTVIFLVVLVKALKQVRLAAQKVQDSAEQASDLVDEVRRTVVNPGVVAMMIEKYLTKFRHSSKRKKDDE